MNRRSFVFRTATALGALATALPSMGAQRRAPRILLRSSWQVVNIGDVAHTPGMLALIEKHIPNAEVILWASADLTPEVAALEHRRFPGLRIVKGEINEAGKISSSELKEAVEWSDFLLHGSGASMVAHKGVAAYHKLTSKPFGVFGMTYGGFGTAEKGTLGKARFVYFRDTVSLEKARADGIRAPVMEFGPDAAFATDLKNEAAAERFLSAYDLEPGQFLVTIPRLRYTPYWKIRDVAMKGDDHRKHARNEAMKEADHAKLREAIVAFVRETGKKVLVCPEDMSQMQVGKEMIVEKLPADVRAKTVWREHFWMPDEAISVYARAFAMLSLEMHSPIMAVPHGLPVVLCRFSEQTSKGFMWRDIGLGDWLFDLDEQPDGKNITAALLGIARNPKAAREKVAKAAAFVRERHIAAMQVLKKELNA